MKFVCHSCSAKYSISDDKISGGTFRVQCKRCGETLVLRDGAAQPPAHDLQPEEPGLRSQRNENSVLFSLRDTSQVAGVLTVGGASTPSQSTGPARASTVRTEGSGLLDIQRLAASYQSSAAQDSAPDGDSAVPIQIADDYTPPAFVLPRPPTEHGPDRRIVWGLFSAAGSLVVASVVLALVLMGRADRPGHESGDVEPSAATVAASTTTDDASQGSAPGTPAAIPDPSASPAPDTTPESTDSAPVAVAANPASENPASQVEPGGTQKARERERSSRRDRSRRDRSRQDRSSRSDRTPDRTSTDRTGTDRTGTDVASRPDSGDAASCMDEIACELADRPPACCARYKRSSSDRADSSHDSTRAGSLPDTLDRAAIMKGINGARSKVRACSSSDPARGKVMVRLKVAGNGRVEKASIKETPSDALGRCVVRAMSSARFARSKKGMSFNYPFLF